MTLLDEIMAKLAVMPAEQIKEIEQEMRREARLWTPSPGPQTDAYYSKADVLLYGGAGGSGKTDLGLGLAFQEHQRSLLMRRRYANLAGLTERAVEINGTRDGFNSSPPPLLRSVNGRYIQFGANQHPGDEQDWQGQPFDLKCVGKGTLVVMADWSHTPIEHIRRGDLVMTLEGPRRVTRVWPKQMKPAVRMSVFGDDGKLVLFQDQSLTHEVLTHVGWVSHDMCGVASPSSICAPKQYRASGMPSELFALLRATQWLHRELRTVRWQQIREWTRQTLDRLCCLVATAFLVPQPQDTDVVASCASPQGRSQPHGWCGHQGPSWLHRESSARNALQTTCLIPSCDGGSWSERQCCQGGCLSDSHRCDVRVHQYAGLSYGVDVARIYLQQRDGVGQPNPIYSEDDDLARTPTRTRHRGRYTHPYTMETRQVAEGQYLLEASFSFREVGVVELFDIEVEDVNHYITAGGIVNRNCFDEATQFTESQIRFHLGWLRSTVPGQRCRAVLGTNPPIDADGDWIIGMFRPWLDLTHPRPAKHGELRWYVTAPDGTDLEVADGDIRRDDKGRACTTVHGMTLLAMSRSFIPGKLKDNPYLVDTNYQANLDGLPEPLRSAVRDGNFMAARRDADWQVIPTAWIIAAQDRWRPDGFKGIAMTAMAFDPAGGGKDSAELAARYGGWYADLVSEQGRDTADGSAAAATIFKHRRDNAPVVVDVGGGYGGAVTLRLKDNSLSHVPFNGANASTGRTIDGQLRFANKRAEVWWRFREALNPDQKGGSVIALPPDPELRADLAAPTYDVTARGIQIEAKEKLRERLGRSPGKGDAVVMCLSEGNVAVKRALNQASSAGRPQFANVGYAHMKKRRG